MSSYPTSTRKFATSSVEEALTVGEDAVVADALDFEQSTVRAEAFNPPTFDLS